LKKSKSSLRQLNPQPRVSAGITLTREPELPLRDSVRILGFHNSGFLHDDALPENPNSISAFGFDAVLRVTRIDFKRFIFLLGGNLLA
jgi:hypothetical protein